MSMWKSLFLSFSLVVSTVSPPLSVHANPDLRQICTRTPGARVVLRKGPGTNYARGLVMVGSGGRAINDYFQRLNYTISGGEEVSVFSNARGTDDRTWYRVGTNQWVAWVRSDFVCSKS